MFLAKLKWLVGAAMIVTALGASGLVYRAADPSTVLADKRSNDKPLSELERLRHENELLKLNLEVVLEKVRAQETELRTLRGGKKGTEKTDAGLTREEMEKLTQLLQKLQLRQSDSTWWDERANWSARMSAPRLLYVTPSQAEADQARLLSALFDEAEAALKVLRAARDAESQRKAADALDKALKKLHEQPGQLKKPEIGNDRRP